MISQDIISGLGNITRPADFKDDYGNIIITYGDSGYFPSNAMFARYCNSTVQNCSIHNLSVAESDKQVAAIHYNNKYVFAMSGNGGILSVCGENFTSPCVTQNISQGETVAFVDMLSRGMTINDDGNLLITGRRVGDTYNHVWVLNSSLHFLENYSLPVTGLFPLLLRLADGTMLLSAQANSYYFCTQNLNSCTLQDGSYSYSSFGVYPTGALGFYALGTVGITNPLFYAPNTEYNIPDGIVVDDLILSFNSSFNFPSSKFSSFSYKSCFLLSIFFCNNSFVLSSVIIS